MTIYKTNKCPKCGSYEVFSTSSTLYEINGGVYYCEYARHTDQDSPATCQDCEWEGKRSDTHLSEKEYVYD